MNPLTNMKNVTKLSEQELTRNSKSSWHDEYASSSWIFVGGLAYDLSEGDIICVFSQYGEIVNINLIRDKKTGKQKGFCFICYEDQRSTVLAVDNLNGIKILGKSIRVDHVKDYKPPKDHDTIDDITRKLHEEGCAPKLQIPERLIKSEYTKKKSDKRRYSPLSVATKSVKRESFDDDNDKHQKKSSKKKDRKKRKKQSSSSSSSSSSSESN
ncbi:hypothetical protein PVAND_003599 [Polypedilum vanderplanki]|uniref:RRM domain-containing protein n=1 Tax=Polypedilum vanderplanki TaxID=319348 RepID=A0A9J6BV20_POLVA|nr:hypothetical protein PVAND_003599 [Polypedilum vanderplanki]